MTALDVRDPLLIRTAERESRTPRQRVLVAKMRILMADLRAIEEAAENAGSVGARALWDASAERKRGHIERVIELWLAAETVTTQGEQP